MVQLDKKKISHIDGHLDHVWSFSCNRSWRRIKYIYTGIIPQQFYTRITPPPFQMDLWVNGRHLPNDTLIVVFFAAGCIVFGFIVAGAWMEVVGVVEYSYIRQNYDT